MTPLKPPMLIDVFRLTSGTKEETVANIIDHYSSAPGGWNHQRCLTSMKHAYDGATDASALIAGCRGEGKPSELDNAKIVEAVLPNIIGRKTQCFPYARKKYALTPKILCPMGPSFFIVEDGIIKLVYVHARNEKRATVPSLAGLAAVFKADILDQDFYGHASDVEIHYVDKRGTARSDKVYNLNKLAEYLLEPPELTMQRFASALVSVMENDRVIPGRRKRKEQPPQDDTQGSWDF